MKHLGPGLSLIAGFAWWGAVLNLAGWGLSFFRALTPFSYGLVLAILGIATLWFFKGLAWSVFFRRVLRRLRHPLPAVFFLTTCLILAGALFYPPSNYDALTYRIPRIMHWLSQDSWFWITTANPRQNYSGVGQEWLLAPILALTKTDRLLFLPNFICFLFLPSVLFRLFRGIGCSGRLAATGMWVLPFAPVYLLQAGGIANDLLGSFWFLASLALLPGLAIKGFFPGASLLALALSTGVKASNLVLLLPWFTKFMWETVQRRHLWRPALVAFPVALAISFAPVAYFNATHTGDWSGDPLNQGGMKTRSLGITCVGNMVLTFSAILQQPIDFGSVELFKMAAAHIPESVQEALRVGYPRWSLQKAEFAVEEGAAWTWLLVVLFMAGFFQPYPKRTWLISLRAATWLSAFVVMGKLASESVPRLLAPLYPLLFTAPVLVSPRFNRLFKVGLFFSLFLLLVPLFLAPSRPLISWIQFSHWIQAFDPDSKIAGRISLVEQAYRGRAQGLLPAIPQNLKDQTLDILLISNGDDTEGPLWRPYGQRRVESRLLNDQPPAEPPDLILIRETEWPSWSFRWGVQAQTMRQTSLTLLAKVGPENWLCLQPKSWPGLH